MKIHMDLDSFFISAERIKNPSLRDIPAAVGGRGDPFIFDKEQKSKIDIVQKNSGAFVPNIFYNSDSTFKEYFIEGEKIRGIIITASYEARKYGIKTGMSIREALSIYPKLIVVPPNHLYYHSLSHKLKEFLQTRIPLVEQFSIDEFFGDLKGWIKEDEVKEFLIYLKKEIKEKFSLPISIGVARSKWTAKLATSFAKPNGIKVIKDDEIEDFIKDIPIEDFPGIGRGYAKRLHRVKIKKLGDIKEAKELFYNWKKPGITLYKRVLGIDNEPILISHPKKSIGISRTIDPIEDREEIKRRIVIMSRYLAFSVMKLNLNPRYFSFKIVYDFKGRSKAHELLNRPFSEKLLKDTMLRLFLKADIYRYSKVIRLSMVCGKFYEKKIFDIFTYKDDEKAKRLSFQTSKARKKYGVDTLKWGVEFI
ncbi:DNA polymerase Y family protein [Nitrosophilus labii]|uniref:DNA polymerase Y family protein n=1 Tax=Nitrosophilus labii TaxID=2706014 RepID=UPI0016573966|nr:DNA polymerase IV [Nitrosophilus labii]